MTMKMPVFYIASPSAALNHAGQWLRQQGCTIADAPGKEVTHLLLSVPSFGPNGTLRDGGTLKDILLQLPKGITVVGGNLDGAAWDGCQVLDLLSDPYYLAQNAQITAHCALKQLLLHMSVILPGQGVLILGWGRIAKCLGLLLEKLGAAVTVAARKDTDLAMAQSLGLRCVDIGDLKGLWRYRAVVNTVPEAVFSAHQVSACRPECVLLDLASKRGMDSERVIWARGLPGIDAPESSGALIGRTVLRLCSGREQL